MTLICGDALTELRKIDAGIVQTCITSPPYWGLRDYGVDGQLGLEDSPESYISALVEIFAEVKRVLRDDGTLWLVLGDSYNAYNGGAGPGSTLSKTQTEQRPALATGYGLQCKSLKPKDLCMIPARVALALQADGWWLRSDIIWHKPNPMPESVTDRPTSAHEHIFLLAKSARYFYDADAIREPLESGFSEVRYEPLCERDEGRLRVPGNTPLKLGSMGSNPAGRNKRNVWTVATQPYPDAHFAVYPPALIEPCVLAGSAEGDTVLDPFFGSGTTGMVALKHRRKFIGIELNPEYVQLAEKRLKEVQVVMF